jgi:hypothetical protein
MRLKADDNLPWGFKKDIAPLSVPPSRNERRKGNAIKKAHESFPSPAVACFCACLQYMYIFWGRHDGFAGIGVWGRPVRDQFLTLSVESWGGIALFLFFCGDGQQSMLRLAP